MISLIESSSYPMIITANDIWDKKFNELRKKCKMVNLKEINYKDITSILQEISKKENLELEKVEEILEEHNTDILQALKDKKFKENDLKEAMTNIVKGNEFEKAIKEAGFSSHEFFGKGLLEYNQKSNSIYAICIK